MLAGDGAPTNNRWTGQVTVNVRDVACVRIVAPLGIVDSGTTITPACSLYNGGTLSESYYVNMRVGTAYGHSSWVGGHTPGAYRRVLFSNLGRGAARHVAGDLLDPALDRPQTGTTTAGPIP